METSLTRQRTAPRKRVLLMGTLMTPRGAIDVRVHDISRDGAQLWGMSEIPDDCDAVFKRGSLFAAARVTWSSGRNVGLRFYRELTPDEVDSDLQALAG